MLPSNNKIISLNEGFTPIRKINGILCKMETSNPTGSYADRASSVIMSNFNDINIETNYIEDFTTSLAYYAKKANIRLKVNVIPETTDSHDLILISKLGSEITFVNKYDKSKLPYENPYTIEGLKTISYEIYEKGFNKDKIYVPAQSGLLVYAIGKGFYELKQLKKDFIEYELVAVKLKNASVPDIIKYSKYKIKVSEVSTIEALKSMIDLSKRGLDLKPLASASYALAYLNNDGISIITGGRKYTLANEYKETDLRKDISLLFSDGKKRTAYEIWSEIGKYTLRGVYKALNFMVNNGELCQDFLLKGERKVKVYWKCQD